MVELTVNVFPNTVRSPATITLPLNFDSAPPTFMLPLMPTPSLTTRAPVVVLVLVATLEICILCKITFGITPVAPVAPAMPRDPVYPTTPVDPSVPALPV